MYKDREIKNANGTLMYLEKPEYGIMVKDSVVVNKEQYDLYMERMKQNKVAPTSTPPEIAEKAKAEQAEAEAKLQAEKDKRITNLEKKVDDQSDILKQILSKLNEKN